MTTTDPNTDSGAAREPSLRERLEAVLPSWTHWHGRLFDGATATWTTTAGTWTLSLGAMAWPKLIGPGGTWNFGSRDADHIIGVLRALDAIDAGSEPGRYCDALCRDVEEDRDRLAVEVEQLRYERTLLGAVRRLLDNLAENAVSANLRHVAGDLAQRIVDEIGHPVTDEPALGPSLRADRDRLAAVVEAARAAALRLLDQERQHDGHGREGHLNADDLAPLLAALGVAATNASCL